MSDASPDVVSQDSSAPAPAPAAPSAPPSTESAAPAQSASATEDVGSKETLLEAVLEALPEERDRVDPDRLVLPGVTSDAARDVKSDPKPGEPGDAPLSAELTKEEFDAYPERTKARIQKLLSEREHYRRDADVTTNLRNFLSAAQIDKEGFSVLLDLGAALRKGDFQTFYAGVRPYVDLAEQALGLTVSPDLQREVETGHMTPDAARRMSAERIRARMAEGQVEETRTQQTQAAQQRQTSEHRAILTNAVTSWEQHQAKADPDFATKQRVAQDTVWGVMREWGRPSTPEQAVQVAQEAYRRAEDHIRTLRPTPKPTLPQPSSAHRVNGALAAPKTLMEAAMQGLARSRA